MKRKSSRKPNKKEENDSNGVEDNEQNGEAFDHEDEAPKDKRRKSSKGGRKNVSFGRKDKEDATSTAESEESEEPDQEEESPKEEKKSKGRKSSKKEVKEVKETDPLAESDEDDSEIEVEKKKSPKKGKKAAKKSREEEPEDDDDDEDEDDDSQYEVEAVLDEKTIKGVRHYLIRWKGYEEESDTWEPENTLECRELISEFKEKKKKEKTKKNKKEKKDVTQSTWDENADYEVNRILEVHFMKGGKREFLINWKGYSQSENTWEPEENLDCKEMIDKFMDKVDKARELEERELRINRKQVQRYTLNPQAEARRMSRRFRGKERVQYHDAE